MALLILIGAIYLGWLVISTAARDFGEEAALWLLACGCLTVVMAAHAVALATLYVLFGWSGFWPGLACLLIIDVVVWLGG